MATTARSFERAITGNARERSRCARTDIPMTASRDVIVVGAGIVGCAVACELARRGVSVEIIDERPIAMGATQASAGVLAPYIEAREGSLLLELTTRSLELYDEFVARITAESG